MNHSFIIIAMSVTVATGIMAKDEKGETPKAETPNAGVVAGAALENKDTTAEEKEERTAKMLEHIKEKNMTLYKALIELQKKNKVAFDAEMEEIFQKHHAEAGKDRGGEGDNDKTHHHHKPRPYPNQLDRLPD